MSMFDLPESHQRRTDIIPNQRGVEEVIDQRISDTTTPIVALTQEEYDALDPPVDGTLYIITAAPE